MLDGLKRGETMIIGGIKKSKDSFRGNETRTKDLRADRNETEGSSTSD